MQDYLAAQELCPACRQTNGNMVCIHPLAHKYYNCHNRVACVVLERALPSGILQHILDSNCLSCNHTPETRAIVESRLKQLILFMGVAE